MAFHLVIRSYRITWADMLAKVIAKSETNIKEKKLMRSLKKVFLQERKINELIVTHDPNHRRAHKFGGSQTCKRPGSLVRLGIVT